MLKRMADSVTVRDLPAGWDAYAGYAGGMFVNDNLVAQFAASQHALHKSIAVNDQEDADILDIESGDAVPSQFPAWFKRQKARGVEKPGAYANASTMPSVTAAASAAGIPESDYVRWVAHYDGIPQLEGNNQAKQYQSHGARGEHYDVSVFDPSFFAASVPPVNPVHYDWFPNNRFLIFGNRYSERATVIEYDKLRRTQTLKRHPNRLRLAVLRARLLLLSGRVNRVAHRQLVHHKPSWAVDHRGWRFQQLIHRQQGQRFV